MMMNIIMAMALSMAPAKADPIDMARKAFNNCLVEVHNTAVTDKASASQFSETIAGACTEQRTKYRELIYKSELSFGSKSAEAGQFADESCRLFDRAAGDDSLRRRRGSTHPGIQARRKFARD